jgi:hypothetical protein
MVRKNWVLIFLVIGLIVEIIKKINMIIKYMGRHKQEYVKEEIAQLKVELYCQACDVTFYNENYKKGKMIQNFERHRTTKKHSLNTEKFRMDLELSCPNSYSNSKIDEKLSINDNNLKMDMESFIDINDDHMTSISSILSKTSLLKIDQLDENYKTLNETCKEFIEKINKLDETNSVLLSNYNNMDSRTHSMIDIINQLKQEHKKTIVKSVSFKDININTNLEIGQLLVKQGKLLEGERDDLLQNENELKSICKQLMILTNGDIKMTEILMNQYQILCEELENSKNKLLNSQNQLFELYVNKL